MIQDPSLISWPTSDQKSKSYGCFFKDTANGRIANFKTWYLPLGKLTDCRFLLLWHYQNGTNQDYTYLSTVSIRGDYLINHYSDYIVSDYTQPIFLQGDEIVIGNKRFPVSPP
ncbi:MAG: hypothetical protein JST90_11395 [Bacteroidetes bacterium]|nr:hypothetical protein [Bacteroidota bacterium]